MEIQELDITDPVTAGQVLEVQRAAYRIEAELIGTDAIPPLHEQLDDLLASSLRWIGIRENSAVVAALAFSEAGGVIDIDRLVVSPSALRRGYGSALVTHLGQGAIEVSTGSANAPAQALYTKLGFVPVATSEPVPGVAVTHFARRAR